jgi:hypothetical protein
MLLYNILRTIHAAGKFFPLHAGMQILTELGKITTIISNLGSYAKHE